ncbi:hypothetical protein [Methanococcoides seepicolus]|jgi:hypothetical protein|uniref:Uncharacterized protein n=1 Tax=Methanococcoides seepicolus TaxID=2828780 RepID=A0A9E4ZGZ5_9EURY|nr:hypothetical protein [Methanococcoides seepicolus]MCM1987693.1 hypothetical protein [Methanococcoides seepicolus]
MNTESKFRTFLENAIWEKTWEDEEDEEGEIQSYEVMTFEEAGMLSNDNGLVVITPDRSTFVVTIQQKM